MSAGGVPRAAPGISAHIGWIDFPCLEKLMEQAAAQRPPSSGLSVVSRTPASGWGFVSPIPRRRNLLHLCSQRLCWRHPRCRASIRTLNGPLWARCTLGSDLKPRPITVVMDLGCWALLSNRRSLKDQPLMRSHPNKAVDVAFNQTSEK